MSYGTLSLGAGSSVGNLTQSGGLITGAGNLTITSSLNWMGGGMAGAGLLTIAAGVTANFSGGSLGFNRNITNAGTVSWTGSSLGGQAGPGITFTNNGVINAALATDNLFYGNTGVTTLVNNGTITKSGVHTATFFNCALVNNGTLSITGGEMSLGMGGGLGGTITLAAGTYLDATGGVFDDHTGTISGAGTCGFREERTT
jgi:hypothetical protein